MANVNDADAKLRGMVLNRLDVAALQTEDAIDAARFQETCDPSRAGVAVTLRSLALVAIFFSANACGPWLYRRRSA
jgi:hypothetical protein